MEDGWVVYQESGVGEKRDMHEQLKEVSKTLGVKKGGQKVAGSGNLAIRKEEGTSSSQLERNRYGPLVEGLRGV